MMSLLQFYRSFGERVSHKSVGSALFLDILGSDDLEYARHLFRFAAVDVKNLGVAVFSRLNQFNFEGFRRHMQFDIIAVVAYTACFRHRIRTNERFAVEIAHVFGPVISDVFECLFSAHNSRRFHNRVYNLLVAGTSAYISMFLEPVADFFSCRVRIFQQQLIRGYDKARHAESALYGSQMHPGVLKRMRIQHSTDAFNRCNGAVLLYILDFSGAGTDYFSIQDNGARSAYAGAASYFCAGQAQAAQYGRQRILFRITDEHTVRAIDVQGHFLQIHNSLPPFFYLLQKITT